ncbi:MAG: thermonuclease family protein [Alphaproteobacteria bacterium]|nr:thermonuclease family protein [Alphaproteobacteria bacterium]
MIGRVLVLSVLFGGSFLSYFGFEKDTLISRLSLGVGGILGLILAFILLKLLFKGLSVVLKYGLILALFLILGFALYEGGKGTLPSFFSKDVSLQKSKANPSSYKNKIISGIVRSVPSGDILQIEGSFVRLYGIDVPGFSQKCLDKDGRAFDCGYESRQRLENLALGKIVECQLITGDTQGNYMATCSLNNKELDIGVAMVYQGWAVALNSPVYAAYEKEAMAAKKGLWAGKFTRPQVLREAQ